MNSYVPSCIPLTTSTSCLLNTPTISSFYFEANLRCETFQWESHTQKRYFLKVTTTLLSIRRINHNFLFSSNIQLSQKKKIWFFFYSLFKWIQIRPTLSSTAAALLPLFAFIIFTEEMLAYRVPPSSFAWCHSHGGIRHFPLFCVFSANWQLNP